MIRSIGEHRRRQENSRGDVRATPGEPIGIFCAVTTRDGHALERDGECVYAMNDVPGGGTSTVVIEVMFADGTWLLCDADELVTK